MASPTPYAPSYDFTDFQSSNPSTPLPASDLEVELNNIQTTTDEIIANLDIIQRSDTAIANNSVGNDQLKSEVTIGLNPADDWVTATLYAANDSVYESDKVYRCLEAHTSGVFATDLAANKWSELLDFDQYITQTAADAASTAADVISTNADAASTAADVISTNADAASTAADVISTNADAASTAADVISTNADAVSTAADVAAAAASATAAAGSVTVGTLTSTSNAVTVDLSTSRSFTHTFTEDTTFSFTNPESTGTRCSFEIILTNDGTGRTPTWPASVKWSNGVEPDLTTANEINEVHFKTIDGGTIYYGYLVGEAFA